MQAYRIEKVIPASGKLELEALPFASGAVVEIIVLGPERVKNGRHAMPLRGTVIKYDEPFEPVVAENEWEALQ
jgi:hypothetical protein